MNTFITLALTASLLTGLLLVLTKHWHGRFSMGHTHGVQKFHTTPTHRIGGVALVSGMVAGFALAPAEVQALLGPLFLASMVSGALCTMLACKATHPWYRCARSKQRRSGGSGW